MDKHFKNILAGIGLVASSFVPLNTDFIKHEGLEAKVYAQESASSPSCSLEGIYGNENAANLGPNEILVEEPFEVEWHTKGTRAYGRWEGPVGFKPNKLFSDPSIMKYDQSIPLCEEPSRVIRLESDGVHYIKTCRWGGYHYYNGKNSRGIYLTDEGPAKFIVTAVGFDGKEETCELKVIAKRDYGIVDNGFKKGSVRSDLGDTNEITLVECLYSNELDSCPIGVLCAPCPTVPLVYSQSNVYSNKSPFPTDDELFWVIHYNNDAGAYILSFNDKNSGPPGQSLPINQLGGVFHISIDDTVNYIDYPVGKIAYMAIDNRYNPLGKNGIPYFSIGSQKDKGNQYKDIGYFIKNSEGIVEDNTRLSFEATLDQCIGGICAVYLDVVARWPDENGRDKQRQFFALLSYIGFSGTPNGAHGHWNFPIKESSFNPGADIAYLNCETVGMPCLQPGVPQLYDVNLSELLIRASDMGLFDNPIPDNKKIDIRGVHFAGEVAGPAFLTYSFSGMKTH